MKCYFRKREITYKKDLVCIFFLLIKIFTINSLTSQSSKELFYPLNSTNAGFYNATRKNLLSESELPNKKPFSLSNVSFFNNNISNDNNNNITKIIRENKIPIIEISKETHKIKINEKTINPLLLTTLPKKHLIKVIPLIAEFNKKKIQVIEKNIQNLINDKIGKSSFFVFRNISIKNATPIINPSQANKLFNNSSNSSNSECSIRSSGENMYLKAYKNPTITVKLTNQSIIVGYKEDISNLNNYHGIRNNTAELKIKQSKKSLFQNSHSINSNSNSHSKSDKVISESIKNLTEKLSLYLNKTFSNKQKLNDFPNSKNSTVAYIGAMKTNIELSLKSKKYHDFKKDDEKTIKSSDIENNEIKSILQSIKKRKKLIKNLNLNNNHINSYKDDDYDKANFTNLKKVTNCNLSKTKKIKARNNIIYNITNNYSHVTYNIAITNNTKINKKNINKFINNLRKININNTKSISEDLIKNWTINKNIYNKSIQGSASQLRYGAIYNKKHNPSIKTHIPHQVNILSTEKPVVLNNTKRKFSNNYYRFANKTNSSIRKIANYHIKTFQSSNNLNNTNSKYYNTPLKGNKEDMLEKKSKKEKSKNINKNNKSDTKLLFDIDFSLDVDSIQQFGIDKLHQAKQPKITLNEKKINQQTDFNNINKTKDVNKNKDIIEYKINSNNNSSNDSNMSINYLTKDKIDIKKMELEAAIVKTVNLLEDTKNSEKNLKDKKTEDRKDFDNLNSINYMSITNQKTNGTLESKIDQKIDSLNKLIENYEILSNFTYSIIKDKEKNLKETNKTHQETKAIDSALDQRKELNVATPGQSNGINQPIVRYFFILISL